MEATIVFSMDTDAFRDDPVPELVRILRAIADRFESRHEPPEEGYIVTFTVKDRDGNGIGRVTVR